MLARGDRYSRGAIAFHWVIAALVVINLAIGLFHDSLPRAWQLITLHRSIGYTVLILSVARLGWRLIHRPPALPEALPAWEKLAAKTVHWAFYALLVAMPLTGWALSSNPEKPRPLSLFGLVGVPPLPVSAQMSHQAHELHELLGWLMLALVVVHVAAALRHHFLLRDTVLSRMFPWVRPRF